MATKRATVGDRVILTKQHPWSGYGAVVERFRDDDDDGTMIVRLDNGISATVWPSEYRLAAPTDKET